VEGFRAPQPIKIEPAEDEDGFVTMPPLEAFSNLSRKYNRQAREIEATALAEHAPKSSVEHLDFVCGRFKDLSEGKSEPLEM
jgi:hypothetical protein